MKYNALVIKEWIIEEVSPMGWSTLISRALPELKEANSRFSPYYVGKNTKWSKLELDIIQYYLKEYYDLQIPESIFNRKGESRTTSLNFFDSSTKLLPLKKAFMKIFKPKG